MSNEEICNKVHVQGFHAYDLNVICDFQAFTYISKDRLKRLRIVKQAVEVGEFLLQLLDGIALHVRVAESSQPFRLREVAHVLRIHLPCDYQQHNVLGIDFEIGTEPLHALGTEHVWI